MFGIILRTTTAKLSSVILFAMLLFATYPAQAQTFKVIHRFIGPDGASPYAGLTMDAAGRLYGTTVRGGAFGDGTVFKLAPSGSKWVLTPLYSFAGGTDGANPQARVIFGPDGSLYGTTPDGGGTGCNGYGCGTVFSLRPPITACKSALCPWTKTTLYAFHGSDGSAPVGDLIFNAGGGIYGVTNQGGIKYNDLGVAYLLTPSNGGWRETVLYNFPLYALHGVEAGLTLDKAGNLYGTGTLFPGECCGAVFELSPSVGEWVEDVLYVFQGGNDGGLPYAGVILDDAGNLYGATTIDGGNNGGTVFELTPSNGSWAFSVLSRLGEGVCCGLNGPLANLVFDTAGNLYGTTFADGAYGLGSVFKLSPGSSGWTYTSLHDFTGGNDGANPVSNVIFDSSGNLYGTASAGAQKYQCAGNGCGVVWEITP